MMESGDRVTVPEEHRKAIQDLQERIRVSKIGLAGAQEIYAHNMDMLFKTIREVMPDLKEWEFILQGKDDVYLMYKKEKKDVD